MYATLDQDIALFDLMHERNMRYHADHRVQRGRQLVGWMYTCDKVTDDDMAAIQAIVPTAERRHTGMRYAPEIVRAAVFVPCKAELKRRKLSTK